MLSSSACPLWGWCQRGSHIGSPGAGHVDFSGGAPLENNIPRLDATGNQLWRVPGHVQYDYKHDIAMVSVHQVGFYAIGIIGVGPLHVLLLSTPLLGLHIALDFRQCGKASLRELRRCQNEIEWMRLRAIDAVAVSMAMPMTDPEVQWYKCWERDVQL